MSVVVAVLSLVVAAVLVTIMVRTPRRHYPRRLVCLGSACACAVMAVLSVLTAMLWLAVLWLMAALPLLSMARLLHRTNEDG